MIALPSDSNGNRHSNRPAKAGSQTAPADKTMRELVAPSPVAGPRRRRRRKHRVLKPLRRLARPTPWPTPGGNGVFVLLRSASRLFAAFLALLFLLGVILPTVLYVGSLVLAKPLMETGLIELSPPADGSQQTLFNWPQRIAVFGSIAVVLLLFVRVILRLSATAFGHLMRN